MAFEKIKESDLDGKGVVGQAEVPGLPALEMQRKVEEIVRDVVIPKLNDFIDHVGGNFSEKTELAAFQTEVEGEAAALKSEIEAAFDAKAEELTSMITSFETQTDSELLTVKNDINSSFNVFKEEINKAIDEFDTRLSNTIIESGAVVSVFGRIGEVKPANGDYTADMVGAAPTEHEHPNLLSRSGGSMEGDIDMAGNKIVGLYSPTDSGDAVNRGFLESYVSQYVNSATENIVTDVFYLGTSAPANTKLLWIDSGSANTIKFYDSSDDTWKFAGAAWT